MLTKHIDLINIFLMIFSAITAFFFPFELFLFSYAVLGPLHYLTEISWLESKNFFSNHRYEILLILGIGIALLALQFLNTELRIPFAGVLLFCAFSFSLVFVSTSKLKSRIIACVLLFIASVFLTASRLFLVFFAILLPTLVHVFLFTGAFMLFGALKSKNKIGLLSVLVFIGCFFALFFITVKLQNFSVGAYVRNAYSSFEGVNLEVMNLINIGNKKVQQSIYDSDAGLSIMRFIAFAYTYHYLNWFSKTKVIHWDKISKFRMNAIIGLWIVSVAVYIYDYKMGLFYLYALSMLHVLLEFPLNNRSFIGIYQEIKKHFSH